MEMNRRLFGFELCDKLGRKWHLNMFVWRHYGVLTQHWDNTGGCLRRTIPDPEKQRIAPQNEDNMYGSLKGLDDEDDETNSARAVLECLSELD